MDQEDILESVVIEGLLSDREKILAHAQTVQEQFAQAAAQPLTAEQMTEVLDREISDRRLTLDKTAYGLAVDALSHIPEGHKHQCVIHDFVTRIEQAAFGDAIAFHDAPTDAQTRYVTARNIVNAYESKPLEISREWPGSPGLASTKHMLEKAVEDAQRQGLSLDDGAMLILELGFDRMRYPFKLLSTASHILCEAAKAALKRGLADDSDPNIIGTGDAESALATFGMEKAAFERKVMRIYGEEIQTRAQKLTAGVSPQP